MTKLQFNQPALRTFDSFWDSFLTDLPTVQKSNNHFFPRANILENDESYELALNVPGRKKEDFKITFENNILSISFENNEKNAEEDKKYIRKEFSMRSFKRSFTLDDKINIEAIAAKYEDGILTLSLPKVEKALPKEIAIS